jgi:nucleotide-binding universal stress UspA family protein
MSQVLVGTNGEPGADGALRAAALLLERSRARVTVVGVVEAMEATVAGGEAGEEMLQRVLVQLARVSPGCVEWAVEIREGDAAHELARVAQEREARLLITGLGHRDAVSGNYGVETTLRVLQQSRTPLLAVPETSDRPLRRAVVATDFSPESLHAARESLALFPSLEDVDFVHVAPDAQPDLDAIHRWLMPTGRDPYSRLDDVSRRIGAVAGVTVRTTPLRGISALEILRHSRATGADLIVAGSRGAGLAQRLIVGSTATQLLCGAECAVLAVPTAAGRPWTHGRRDFVIS